jgi:hypothetical protein
MLQGGRPTDGPARREPFVRLEYRIAEGSGHTARVRTIFLPRSGLVLADDGATWMRPLALATLREQARRVAPFAADRLPVSAPVARRSPVAGESTSARWPVSVAAALALALASALAIGAVRVRRARRGGATGAAA